MKRRRLLKALAAAPAIPIALAQQPATNNTPAPNSPAPPPLDPTTPPAPLNRTPTAAAAPARLTTAVADDVADMQPRFFNSAQFAALRRLSEVLMPSINGAPSAIDAKAPEFLDFLLKESPAERQQLYRAGLDQLNVQAKKQFNKSFSETDATQAVALLAPLKQPWTFDAPADPLAAFLRAAKQDIRTATVNSREYVTSAANSPSGRRGGGGGGMGLYWYPID
jgi:hypothetical protein